MFIRVEMKLKYLHTYVVTGFGTFPVDMLRTEMAWPMSYDDSSRMSLDPWGSGRKRIRSIRLVSYKAPDRQAWASQGWKVDK